MSECRWLANAAPYGYCVEHRAVPALCSEAQVIVKAKCERDNERVLALKQASNEIRALESRLHECEAARAAWVQKLEAECETLRSRLQLRCEENSRYHTVCAEMCLVLQQAEHNLTTLHGLIASDGLNAYGDAQREGCDPEGAWECFVAQTWKIDESKMLTAIATALSSDAGRDFLSDRDRLAERVETLETRYFISPCNCHCHVFQLYHCAECDDIKVGEA